MKYAKIKWVLAAALAVAGFGMTNSAQAGVQQLGSSGWKAVTPDTFVLTVDSVVGDTVFLTKTGTFTADLVQPGFIKSVAASFVKTDPSTIVNKFVIVDESLTNNTGVAWGGFIFGAQNGAIFDPAATGNFGHDESDDPFTTGAFSNGNTLYTLGGGTLANGAIWTPGNDTPPGVGHLTFGISATDPFFVLKEQPVPGTPIPLPAAAWSGLTGFAGLGAVKLLKKVRGLLA